VHVENTLKAMEKDQLVQFVMGCVSQSEVVGQVIAASMPRPSLDSVGVILGQLEKELNEAFP
jgi:hypothetical protein